MAITPDTLGAVRGMRIETNSRIGHQEQQIITSWSKAWSELRDEWELAIEDLIESSENGEWPSRQKIKRAKKAQQAMNATAARMDELLADFNANTVREAPSFTKLGSDWEARLMNTQLPTPVEGVADVVGYFDRVNPNAIHAIVDRTQQRITSLTKPIGPQAEAEMKRVLVRGVSLGQHPDKAARELLTRLEGSFNGGRNRALVIMRTELLDASRAAAHAQDKANTETLVGWQWIAQLDSRTCPSCWSMHGSVHDSSETGPNDHQQGRCARLPKLKSWKDLGFDIPEPKDILPDAQATFNALSREKQLAIMGPERLRMLDDGSIGWADLSSKRSSDGWRDSYAPTSTSDLKRRVSE